MLKTHAIDPQVNEARDFVLEDVLVEGPLERWALVRGVGAATPAAPRQNLTGDRYVTDRPRLGLFVNSPEHAAGKHVIKYEFIPDAAKPGTGGKCMRFADGTRTHSQDRALYLLRRRGTGRAIGRHPYYHGSELHSMPSVTKTAVVTGVAQDSRRLSAIARWEHEAILEAMPGAAAADGAGLTHPPTDCRAYLRHA